MRGIIWALGWCFIVWIVAVAITDKKLTDKVGSWMAVVDEAVKDVQRMPDSPNFHLKGELR